MTRVLTPYSAGDRATYERGLALFSIVQRLQPVTAGEVFQACSSSEWSRAGVALVLRRMLAAGYLCQSRDREPYRTDVFEFPSFEELREARERERFAIRSERGLSAPRPIVTMRNERQLASWLRV